MIWSPRAILATFFGGGRDGAGRVVPFRPAPQVAERWSRALRAQPELALDLIRMGGVLDAPPATLPLPLRYA